MTRDNILVGVDFDGTLAPLVDHPDQAVPDPRALRHLEVLAKRERLTVAVVSGRSLADLRTRLGELPGAILIGEHGNDTGEDVPGDPRIEEAAALVRVLASDAEGAIVEVKPHSVTFHYRHLDEPAAARYLNRLRSWAALHDSVRVIDGKKVIELSVATRNKGDAIRELAGGRGVIFIGDDTTDETVFEMLGPDDVGVKVGEGPTAGSHRVKDIDGVVRILELIDLASR